jgi:hypothetical protein
MRSESATPVVRLAFVALSNDIGTERILGGLARSGFECAVISSSQHFCAHTRAVKRHFSIPAHHASWLGALFVHSRLKQVLRDWQPRLILPLDDLAARLLRGLAVSRRVSPTLRRVLVDSLGAREGYLASVNRQALMDVAAQIKINKPSHCRDVSAASAVAAAQLWGYPIVVKEEHTCGGTGIIIARDSSQLLAQLRSKLGASWRRKLKLRVKRALQSAAGFYPDPTSTSMLQSFVPGVPAFRTLVTWKGEVLAGASFVAEQTYPTGVGASTIVRYVENDEMKSTSAAMTAALKCSGFVSFDFILDAATGRATLIEMNARCVGATHLGALFGHDLCDALSAALSGKPTARPRAVPTAAVALFPKELRRDPDSPYLKSAAIIHDVPSDDPRLMQAYARWLAKIHPLQAAVFSTT